MHLAILLKIPEKEPKEVDEYSWWIRIEIFSFRKRTEVLEYRKSRN
jgi:hypothetical protein